MSWAAEALQAIRKIILIKERIDQVSEQVKLLADGYRDLDWQLHRLEAKFEMIEKVAARGPRRLPPEKPES